MIVQKKRLFCQASCILTCQLLPLICLMLLALFFSKGNIKLQIGTEFSQMSSSLSGTITNIYSESEAVLQDDILEDLTAF